VSSQQQLVQVGPDTWEVRTIEVQPQAKKRTRRQDKRAGLYLAPDGLSLRDEHDQPVALEFVILKRVEVSGHLKIYLRYRQEGQIYSGHTVSNPKGWIRARVTKFKYLDEQQDSKLRVCAACHERFARVPSTSRDTFCPVCKERKETERLAKQQQAIIACSTPGCNKSVNKENKTGLCRRCFSRQGDFAAVSREFNPFYGRMVPIRRGSSEQPVEPLPEPPEEHEEEKDA
jgi:hypothetical protein